MNGERKRYLAELLLSLLLTAAVTGAIIGIRYRSYQAEMDRMALILEAEETNNEIFRILKEEETISDGETGRILYPFFRCSPLPRRPGQSMFRPSHDRSFCVIL